MFESFTKGLGEMFFGLLMRLCDKQHAGMQYALVPALFSRRRMAVAVR